MRGGKEIFMKNLTEYLEQLIKKYPEHASCIKYGIIPDEVVDAELQEGREENEKGGKRK